MSLEEALRRAVQTYSNLLKKAGFSAYQRIYGKSNIIPGITDGNPATDEPPDSEDMRMEMSKRLQTEEIFRKIDSDERIKKC